MLGKSRWSSTVVGRTGCTKRGSVRRSEFKEDSIWVKLDRDHDRDLDALLFSSISSFSYLSSGGFSSSDDESIFRYKSRSSCFASPWSKVVRTSVSGRSVRTERKPREVHIFDDYHYSCSSKPTPKFNDDIIMSKSRALKIYGNLKKVRQPLSQSGRVANFLNSIFTAEQTKKNSEHFITWRTRGSKYGEEIEIRARLEMFFGLFIFEVMFE